MTQQRPPRPVVLCILDGWGYREETADNAVAQADTPNFDHLRATVPGSLLTACGTDVGLPEGQIGNSEVGHMNLGAGRVVLQELPKIDHAIEAGELDRNDAVVALVDKLKRSGGRVHLIGLISPGGVHSHQRHVAALARVLAEGGIPVLLHLITDGRDTPPRGGYDYVDAFLDDIKHLPRVQIATLSGRYYAMDRDKRWERVARAYDAIAKGEAAHSASGPLAAVQASYDAGHGDEFIEPTVIGDYTGMRDGDGLVAANFRADRMREILGALVDPDFDGFDRGRPIAFAATLGMIPYSDHLNQYLQAIFPPKSLQRIFGEVVAEAGQRQLRLAETEKYAHVTFFFNGGQDVAFAGEERVLVQSPRVATYDEQPEMSAGEVTDKAVAAIESGAYDTIVMNYANPDMVGHTGSLPAAIEACEAVDRGLGRILAAVEAQGGVTLVTADHGNADIMRDSETGQPHTAHTLSRVPLLIHNAPWVVRVENGRLADIAPTMLKLMGLAQPADMTGSDLTRQTAVNDGRQA